MRIYLSLLLCCLVTLPISISATFAQTLAQPDAATLLAQAREKLTQGQYALAVESYTRAIELTPNDATAYSGRSEAYEKLGKHELAIADCDTAVKLNPNYAYAYVYRGWIYENIGKYDQAIASFDTAIKLDPNSAYAYNNRGWTYECLSKHDLAIADFTTAIKLDPKYATAYYNRGWTNARLDEYNLALDDFAVALKLDPTNADVYLNRGCVYERQGKYDLALVDFAEVIRLAPTNAAAYLNRGCVYANLGKHELAIAECDMAIKLDPTNADSYATRGMSYMSRGKQEQALADIAAASKLDPNNEVVKKYRSLSPRAEDHANGTAPGPDRQAFFTGKKKSYTADFASTSPLIFVKVRIGNARKDYPFVLDTGANITVISEELARELKLKKLGEPSDSPDAGGASFTAWPCLVDAITLGTCRVEHPTCVVGNLQTAVAGSGEKISVEMLGGVLGADFLRHFRVTIDYARKKITFAQTTDALSGTYMLKAVKLPQPAATQLAIPISVDGQPLNVVPDTGSSHSALPLSFLPQLNYPPAEKVTSNGPMFIGLAGDATSNDMLVRLHDLQVGDCHISNYLVGSITDEGVLGTDFLAQFLVVLDYPSNTVALTPAAHQQFRQNTFTTGIGNFRLEQDGLCITGIWANSPAAQAGLHPGDLILAINGNHNMHTAPEALFDGKVTSLLLLVESAGVQRSVTVNKAFLFPPLAGEESPK